MTLLHQKKVPAKISPGRIYCTVDIITVKALEGSLPRHPCSGAVAREAEHHVRPPFHVSGCEMAHFNTIFVKLGIGCPCCDQLTAVKKAYPLTSVT